MMLLIDNSNTRTKFLWVDHEELEKCTCKVLPTAELSQQSIAHLVKQESFTCVVIASVVPWAGELLKNVLSTYCLRVHMLDAYTAVDGLIYDYTGRETLGADRVANIIAVAKHYALPCVAIDAGTAVTVDVVLPSESGEAVYVGGTISPGVYTMLASLKQGTALLPNVKMGETCSAVGKNTCEAIQSGVYFGVIGAVNHIVNKCAMELGMKPHVVLTGGDASMLSCGADFACTVDKLLTFRGLLNVAQSLS